MARAARSIRKAGKSALQALGLYGVVSRLRRWPYRNTKSLVFRVGGADVEFGTADAFSNWWFFPRYAGGKLHEPKVTLLLVEALREARCFADVGANLGWYTCVAARHLPRGSVHSFEMDARNFAVLQENVERNAFANVEANAVAVSDTAGVTSYRRPAGGLSAVLRLTPSGAANSAGDEVAVASLCLDEYFAARGASPDVLKIDVEGAEMKVLRGMRRILDSRPPVLFLEVHPRGLATFGNTVREVLSFLVERGYSITEVEEMRSKRGTGSMRRLSADSALRENSMLRADPPTARGRPQAGPR